jgi:hypothetical protein
MDVAVADQGTSFGLTPLSDVTMFEQETVS